MERSEEDKVRFLNDQVRLRHEQRADLHRQGQLHLRRQREHPHHRERLYDLDVHLRLREPPYAGPEREHHGGPGTCDYAGNGMLVKSVEASTWVFAYEGQNRLFAENTGTSSIARYIYADGLLIASVNASTTSYYHEDALGSVRLVSSSTATPVFSANYRGYGSIYAPSGKSTFQSHGQADRHGHRAILLGGEVLRPCQRKIHDGRHQHGDVERSLEPEQVRLRSGQPDEVRRPDRAL